MQSRDATTHWEGSLKTGKGQVTLDSSNAGQFEVSFPTRFVSPDGRTSPEELIAAAHSSCYAMQLSNMLDEAGHAPTSLDVSAEVTLDVSAEGAAISGIALTVRAVAPGLAKADFDKAAQGAKETCPVSKALAAVTITLDASLEE